MKLNHICALALALPLAFSFPSHAATLTVGQPAPPLVFTQLYGAPEGTKTDWPSLRGKVVVLEFWATWCAPCIAEIPHLNALAASLASSNVQFISIDDEDPVLIKTFRAKKQITGWVGLVDPKSTLFETYGAQLRPTTVVIDTEGRIAATLSADLITKDQLLALAAGKPIVFPEDKEAAVREKILKQSRTATTDSSASPDTKTVHPIFEISISPGDPDGQPSIMMHNRADGGGYYYDIKDGPLPMLFQLLAGVPEKRLVIHGPIPKSRYCMRISLPNTSLTEIAPATQLAIATAAGMKLSHVTSEEDAWILTATSHAATLLSPTASQHGSMCFYNPTTAKLTMVKTSLDGLAPSLENALGLPVVNETGITGEFDANLDLPKGGSDAIKSVLETNLGLTITKARHNIDRIVLDPLPAPPPAPAKAADGRGKPALAPSQQAQSVAVPNL